MDFLLAAAERVIGRRLLWKIARRAYLYARGAGSLDMERNGEVLLQKMLSRWSARNNLPLNVIDVGANYGQWSISFLEQIAAARAPKACFTLFEPVPAIRDSLSARVANWAEVADVSILPFAVSDQPGTARFRVTDLASGDHHLECEAYSFEGTDIEVEVVILDDFTASRSIGIVDIVKIDAEGYDPKVMKGMKAMLQRGDVDIVQFEYSVLFVRSRAYLYDIFEQAHGCGYHVALLSHRGIELHQSWHNDLERFYGMSMLLLHPRAKAVLPVRIGSYREDNTYA